MKKFVLPAIILVATLALLAACGRDSNLHGSWEWELDSTYVYTFNSNGTGTRGGAAFGIDNFRWSTPGNGVLRLNFTSGPMFNSAFPNRQDFTYSISGNTLTIVGEETWHYTRR